MISFPSVYPHYTSVLLLKGPLHLPYPSVNLIQHQEIVHVLCRNQFESAANRIILRIYLRSYIQNTLKTVPGFKAELDHGYGSGGHIQLEKVPHVLGGVQFEGGIAQLIPIDVKILENKAVLLCLCRRLWRSDDLGASHYADNGKAEQ